MGSRLLALLTSSMTAAGLALVIDDIHWADVASVKALTFALRRLRDDPVVTVLGCRDEAIADLPTDFGRLIADDGRQLTLGGLSDAPLVSLSEALGRGRLSPLASRRLGRHTAGNPLHAAALLQELDADQLERRPGASLPAPRSFANLPCVTGWRPAPPTMLAWPERPPPSVAGGRRPGPGRRPLRPSPPPAAWLPGPRSGNG